MADEAKRTNPRDMILKSIEESLPKGVSSDAGEVLKQAVELHAGAHRGARPSSPQVKLSRQNVVTIVKGTRESGLSDREIATSVTRQERKAGEFTMTFRIPEEYQVRLPLMVSDCHWPFGSPRSTR